MLSVITDPYNRLRRAIFDNLFRVPVTIDVAHHETHEGDAYAIATFVDPVADEASLDIGVLTPAGGKWGHFVAEVDFLGMCELYIYEAPTYTGGTSITPRNRNRNYADNSIMTAVSGPTVSAVGTELVKSKAGSGTNNKTVRTGQVRSQAEWILRADTKYLFRVTNESGGNSYIAPTINWYEHTND